jgi:hypothetical protein
MPYTPAELRDFVRDYLGPTLANGGYGGVKILVGDDQKPDILSFANTFYSDPLAASYVWGIGAHWYLGPWFEQVDEASLLYPAKKVLSTEATEYPGIQLGEWDNAANYANAIIGDLNNGAVGWIDWNIALDTLGGPNNHVSNPCSSTVIVDTATGNYWLNTQYYALGHFSKFVKAGAFKIGNITSVNGGVEASAFRNPGGQLVIVAHNKGASAAQVKVKDGAQIFKTTLPALSITTFTYTGSNNALYPARETISLRAANGSYVTNPNNGFPLSPSSGAVGNAQKFYLYYKADGYATLKSLLNGKYVSVRSDDELFATPDTASTAAGSWERFELRTNSDGTLSLRAAKNGKYVQTSLGFSDLQATSSAIGSWEKFIKTTY